MIRLMPSVDGGKTRAVVNNDLIGWLIKLYTEQKVIVPWAALKKAETKAKCSTLNRNTGL